MAMSSQRIFGFPRGFLELYSSNTEFQESVPDTYITEYGTGHMDHDTGYPATVKLRSTIHQESVRFVQAPFNP